MPPPHRPKDRRHGAGFDYVLALIDGHSRLACAEIHDDERADICAEFFARAVEFFAAHGIDRIERVMTDNAFSHRHGKALAAVIAGIGARHKFIKQHCPWQNGKVERLNRTLATAWTCRQVFTSNAERSAAQAPWLDHHKPPTTPRSPPRPPTHQPPITNLTAGYTWVRPIGTHCAHDARQHVAGVTATAATDHRCVGTTVPRVRKAAFHAAATTCVVGASLQRLQLVARRLKPRGQLKR